MGTKPTFDFKQLMAKAGAPTARDMAVMCGLNTKGVHNRMSRGIGWIEADELAVRCGFLPWEVWPEWADIDPTEWMAPVSAVHHNDLRRNLDHLTQERSAFGSVPVAA